MIADLDETLRQLLISEMPIKNGEIDISFDQPKREWSARLSRPSLNFFLYDLRENPQLRRHQWERTRSNGRQVEQKRTPYRLDCYYMLTAWAAEPEDEHRLLTRALLALFRYPVLPRERYVGKLIHQPYDIATQLARHDRLTNPAEVWGALDNEMRPTVSYLVTLALDPWTEISGPLVQSFTMHTYQRRPDGGSPIPSSDMVFIGGTVRHKDSPQAGITVALKDTGYVDVTGADGRFRLGSLAPGRYTLIAWPPEGRPRQKSISVPGDEDYDIML